MSAWSSRSSTGLLLLDPLESHPHDRVLTAQAEEAAWLLVRSGLNDFLLADAERSSPASTASSTLPALLSISCTVCLRCCPRASSRFRAGFPSAGLFPSP
jgi:hypothetical protein